MKFKRKQLRNGEPVVLTPGTVTSESCCDCGLVHTVFVEAKKGKAVLYKFRDDHETERVRKKRKK